MSELLAFCKLYNDANDSGNLLLSEIYYVILERLAFERCGLAPPTSAERSR